MKHSTVRYSNGLFFIWKKELSLYQEHKLVFLAFHFPCTSLTFQINWNSLSGLFFLSFILCVCVINENISVPHCVSQRSFCWVASFGCLPASLHVRTAIRASFLFRFIPSWWADCCQAPAEVESNHRSRCMILCYHAVLRIVVISSRFYCLCSCLLWYGGNIGLH